MTIQMEKGRCQARSDLSELWLRIICFRNDETVREASQSKVVGKITAMLSKLKEPGLQVRLFQFFYFLRRRREITYEGNFITCLRKLLDATPTSPTRLRNAFYEPFLSKATHCLRLYYSLLSILYCLLSPRHIPCQIARFNFKFELAFQRHARGIAPP